MQHEIGGGITQLQVELLAAPVAWNEQANGGGLAGGEGEAVGVAIQFSADGLDGCGHQLLRFAVVGGEHRLAGVALVEQIHG